MASLRKTKGDEERFFSSTHQSGEHGKVGEGAMMSYKEAAQAEKNLLYGEGKAHPDPVGRLLKISEVCNEVGLSRASIYRLMTARHRPFPKPLKIGFASRWALVEINAWKAATLADRDGECGAGV